MRFLKNFFARKRNRLLAVVLFTLFLLRADLCLFVESVQTYFWPSAFAVIEKTEIVANSQGARSPYTWEANVYYKFSVEDKDYESSRYSIFPTSMKFLSEKEAISFTENFKIGDRVPIYFSSTKPSYAVLVRGMDYGYLLLNSVGMFAILIAIYAFLRMMYKL